MEIIAGADEMKDETFGLMIIGGLLVVITIQIILEGIK